MLPAAYHRNGWDGGDLAPEPGQRRFCDPDVETFLARVDALRAWADGRPGVSVGIAAHSVRAVPAGWLEAIARHADTHELVRHVHASEQRRELEQCQAEHGCSPIELLAASGFLGPRTSVIHGIHVSRARHRAAGRHGHDGGLVPDHRGQSGRRLPAGHGLPRRRGAAGHRCDSQVRIDPFEEARELETVSRRERELRAGLLAASGGELWAELCRAGAHSLGIEAGAAVRVDLEHPDLRGIAPEDLPLALVTSASAGVVVPQAA